MSSAERRNGNGTNDSGRSDDTAVPQSLVELRAQETDTSKAKEESEKEDIEDEKPEKEEPHQEETQKEEPEEEEEPQEEPVTPEIQAWRDTVSSTLTEDTAMRYYLKNADVGLYVSYGDPLEPVPISNDSSFLAFLSTKSISPGWYWVVFGVSLTDTDGSALDNITFEVLNGDIQATFYTMIHPCKASVENGELADLPKDDFARLRLHRQIEINDKVDDCLWVQIALEAMAGSGKEVSFDLHYIELASPNFKSAAGVKDHVLWGEGKPDQFIRVGAHATTDTKEPIAIAAYDFSVFGTYAATLYFTTGEAHIDVWDLRASSSLVSTSKSQAITTPLAHTSFTVAKELTTYAVICKEELLVSISSTGSQVIMGYVDESEHAVPLRIYRCTPTAPADRGFREPWELRRAPKICESLQNYFGYGSFHISDLDDSKAENERYFTFNGTEFDLYSTEGEWAQLYSLPLGVDKDSLVRLTNMESLRESLRGRYFAWTGDKSGVSIWDFETGKFVTAILIPEDTGNVRAALSADGSMIAISVNGSVQIHDVVSGIKLGVYKAGERDDNELEVVFGQDHFMALNSALSWNGDRHIDAHSIVRVHDMKIVKTHIVYWQYETEFPTSVNPVFAYCQLQHSTVDLYYNNWSGQYMSSAGTTFDVGADYVYSRGSYFRELTFNNGSVNATISLGSAAKDYQGFFMAESSRVVLIMNGFLQVWHLPSTDGQLYELVHVEAFVEVPEAHANNSCITEVLSVQACKHGCRFSVALKPIRWVRGLNGEEVKDDLDSNKLQMLTFPRTTDDTFSKTEKYRYENGIISLLDTYADSGLHIQEAVIRFLINHIRPSMTQPVSSLVILCRSWKHGNRVIFENIITDLLPATRITWIPDINATKDEDPLSILTETAKKFPIVLGACKIIMNYCVGHATASRNLSFLSPLFRSMSDIMELFQEEALECLGRIAYIPVRRRDYILENHIVAHSPRLRLQFWKAACQRLDKIKDPVMQLHVTTERPCIRVDGDTRPIFMASFDALWQHRDDNKTKKDVLEEAMLTQETTWWKTLYHIIRLKFHLTTHTYVECHEFSLEFFDNPAIAALVAYKWNTIGYAYWASRFFFQCVFYVLVVVATLLQVYHEHVGREQLAGVFIAIIVMAAVFLWLELLQAVKNFDRYSGTLYNFLDITAYTLSIASSANMLVILHNDDSEANTPLINVAFGKGDDGWRLAWIESRLRYIEAAENLSYHIPGFRQSHNCFPKEIYFSTTSQKVRAYRKKQHAKDHKPGDLSQHENWARDYQADDNDGYGVKVEVKLPAPTKMEEAAVQEKDNDSNKSVNGDVEQQPQEETDSTEARSSEDGEEEADASEDKKDLTKDDSAVEELKAQVQDLQRQIASLQASQQGLAQRQFQELKDLLLVQSSYPSAVSNMADGGNSDASVVPVPVLVPEFRMDVSGQETCTKKESMKVFFKPVQENNFTPSEERQDPVTIKSSGNFEVHLDTRTIHPGWYWAVFCLSLEHLDDIKDKLDSIIFDVKSKEMSTGVVYPLDYTCKTVIGNDEIRCLPRTKSARLKLHRQIEVTADIDTDLCISIKVQTVSGCIEDVSFDIDYFELACRHICSEDHVLWGEGKPDQFIRIGAEDTDCEKVPIAIEASDVSVTGKLAVTIYFNPAVSDTHIPGNRNTRYNLAALRSRATDRAATPDGGRGSSHTPDHASTLISKQDSTHNPAQVLTHGLEHTASLGPPQDARTPTLSQAHSHASDHVHILDGHSHTPSNTSTLGEAHIDVWDLSEPSGQVSSDNPQEITKPLASWSFTVHALKKPPGDSHEKSYNDFLQLPKPTINISSTGLHIIMAVGWAKEAVHVTPFLIFRRTTKGSEEQNQSAAYNYKPVSKTCQSLQDFFGYGSFHNTDKDAPNCENERYFNFHGSTFDVYSTNGGWKQLYSLTFGIKGVPCRPEDMNYLTQSLRGRYFAWTGDRGAVSIWDFETGTFVNTILVPKDKRGVCAALCEDGSMIAITVNGCIQLHDVVSGIKLGVHPTQWKEDNGSEIIFRQDYFMALDAAKSTNGRKNIDARSIFRVRDMKVVKTHHVFWQYAAEYASTLNPIFLYRQGAILNIKRLGNILCPNEDDDCTPDTMCDFKDAKIVLSDNNWTDRNHPSAGTTFVLVPDNSPSRPLSIMRLNITNVYSDAYLSLGPSLESRSCSGFYMASSSQLVLILNGRLQIWRLPSEADQKYELVHVEAFVAVSKAHANDICITKASSVQSCTHGRKFVIKIDPIKWEKDLIQWVPDMRKQETEDDQENEVVYDDLDEEDYPDSDQPQILTFPRAAGETFPASEKYRYEKGVASLLDTYADSDLAIKDAIVRFLVDRIRPSSKYSSSLVILCRFWKWVNRVIFENIITDLLPATCITWIPDSNATKSEDPLSILTKIAKKIPSVLGACRIIMDYCVNHAIKSKNLSFLSPFLRSLKRIMSLFPTEAHVYLRRIAYIPVSDKWRDYIVENSTVVHPPWHCKWRDYIVEKSTVVHPPWHCIRIRKTSLRLEKIKKPVMQLHVTTRGKRSKASTFTRPIYVAAFDALWHFKDSGDSETKRITGESAVKQASIVKPWSIMEISMRCLSIIVGSTVKQELMAAPASTQEATAARSLDGPINQATTKTQKTTWWKTVYHMFRLKCRLKTHTYVTCHNFSLEYLDNPAIAALVAYKWNTIGYAYWAFRFFFQCVFYVLVFVAALLQVYHENVRRTQLKGVFVAIIAMGAVFLWLELLQAIKDFKRYRRDAYNCLDIVAYSLPIVASFIMLMILCENKEEANTRILSYSVLAVFIHMVTLINKAFTKGDDEWRLDWIESRLHYIVLAENLSYHIPGFRQTHDWFPKEIYFAATAKDVEVYGEVALKVQVQALKMQLSEQQEQAKLQFMELKKLLRGGPESSRAGQQDLYEGR
ncbi:hypothetical protein KVV02_003902 [Mortierella alpina]|uniref:Uncharacterized protein n=1 Tax=Mortierella alpina TaxID=64518 RepID=A0A9P7ZYF7_MORAP|nr:hypothetical protein KVV02_003902 [Mortierella alpina]